MNTPFFLYYMLLKEGVRCVMLNKYYDEKEMEKYHPLFI